FTSPPRFSPRRPYQDPIHPELHSVARLRRFDALDDPFPDEILNSESSLPAIKSSKLPQTTKPIRLSVSPGREAKVSPEMAVMKDVKVALVVAPSL
ncbi:hypothetical protein U1Q18_024840, partial [Sarracenia purpurea var. burkii]